jgi:hypothetical protein
VIAEGDDRRDLLIAHLIRLTLATWLRSSWSHNTRLHNTWLTWATRLNCTWLNTAGLTGWSNCSWLTSGRLGTGSGLLSYSDAAD